MKRPAPSLIFPTIFLLAPLTLAGVDESLGGLPSRVAAQSSGGLGEPGMKIGPGDSRTNTDGVSVSTDRDSPRGATMRGGNEPNSSTRVSTGNGWKGKIEHLEEDEQEVLIGTGSKGSISGSGGRVTLASGCVIKAKNDGPEGSRIVFVIPGGRTVTLESQESCTIDTQ